MTTVSAEAMPKALTRRWTNRNRGLDTLLLLRIESSLGSLLVRPLEDRALRWNPSDRGVPFDSHLKRGRRYEEVVVAPIEHVVIIVKENHTFDNYFGTFAGANGKLENPAQNPPPGDPNHRHEAWMARAGDTAHEVQYSEQDIPGYFALARQFTLCDNYFSEVAGPSTPNHLMLICADAPIINNPAHHYRPTPGDQFVLPSLPLALENKGLSWANFGGYAFHYVHELAGHRGNHSRDLFAHHAQQGDLPTVSWVYGDGRPDLSEHPTQNVTHGMQWTIDQVKAVVASGLWDKVAILVTWDDWGGWFDHVDPPEKEQWDSSRAHRPVDAHPEFDGQQFRYGSRVPLLAISPYAKAGHVSSQENSHVSVPKFCEDIFGIPPLTERDGASNGLSDCFNFDQEPLPPPVLG
jgi:phospholipase C